MELESVIVMVARRGVKVMDRMTVREKDMFTQSVPNRFTQEVQDFMYLAMRGEFEVSFTRTKVYV